MRLQTRTLSGVTPNEPTAADVESKRQADPESTLGLDEEWSDVPTTHLDAASDHEATADVAPLSPDSMPIPSVESAAPTPAPAQSSAPVPRDITTGTLLCNRYVLGRLLGTGGSSLIFQAEDRRRIGAKDFGSRIAIKVLRQEMRGNTHALTRLRREFRQMQRLSHPGIAKVHELACDDEIWFMTMELIEGQTINQWLKSSTSRTAGLAVIGACCEALDHAHEAGVVHGDLKPSNVLVLANGAVKLVDFGSAAERDASMGIIDKERSFAATPPYASPQVLAGEVADPRDDVFSLACLAYAVLTQGEHPFGRKSSAEALQAQMRPVYARGMLPRQFEVIVRALAWDREQRPASVREFMHALLASDLRREIPVRDSASSTVEIGSTPVPHGPGRSCAPARELQPTTDVKPEDVARLQAAVAASQAQPERVDKAPTTARDEKPAKSDPFERFKGYVAGPLLPPSDEELESLPAIAAGESREPPKRKWLWPWQRSALFALLLVTGAAIIATRFAIDTEPIRQIQELFAHPPVPPPAPVAEPSVAAEPQPKPVTREAAEQSSAPAASKATPAPARGEISFTARTLTVGANQTVAALSVKRLNSTRGRAKVAWTIEDGTARRGVHYDVAEPQLIEFLDGQSVRSLFIPLTPDSSTPSARHSKTFTVKLQQASGGPALGEIKQVYVTIVGDVTETVATADR